MRKIYIFLLLFILLVTACFFFLFNDNNYSSIDNTFSYKKTDSLTRIFLSDRKGNNINLEKRNHKWILNNKHSVRNDAIETLLSTISNVQIRRSVSNSEFNTVVKNLATHGVKVELYSNNKKPVKVYTVGGSTKDHLGTYMIMNGSKEPFVTHITGFNGFLYPRYGIQANELQISSWRDTKIFNIDATSIKSVGVFHANNPKSSFQIEIDTASLDFSLLVKDYKGNQINYNKVNTINFLNNFKAINCEAFKNERRSLIDYKDPIHIISLHHLNGIDTLRLYSMQNDNNFNPEVNFNVERMYATLNNQELMLVQNYVFNKLLITISDLKN